MRAEVARLNTKLSRAATIECTQESIVSVLQCENGALEKEIGRLKEQLTLSSKDQAADVARPANVTAGQCVDCGNAKPNCPTCWERDQQEIARLKRIEAAAKAWEPVIGNGWIGASILRGYGPDGEVKP